MPPKLPRTPKYRLHKPSGLVVVTLDGKDVYLGSYGSHESQAEYRRLVAEWLTTHRQVGSAPGGSTDLTVNELMLAYLRHVDGYYRKNGKPTTEPVNIRFALRPLKRLYGHTIARDFGPKALKTVRQSMIEANLCRNEVNKRVRHVVRMYKWAVENELVPASVHYGLKTVSGLKKGRSEARESQPVKPVPDAYESVRVFEAEIHKSLKSNDLRDLSLSKVVLLLARTYVERRRILGQTPMWRPSGPSSPGRSGR